MNNTQSMLIKSSLRFLHDIWWRVQIEGLERLPEQGPIFIAVNGIGEIPWPALMLIYALTMNGSNSNLRRINVLAGIDSVDNERIHLLLRSLNCLPWSYDSAKELLNQGELLLVFPEQISNAGNGARQLPNRLKHFDWTKFLPAIETGASIYPLATLDMDELKPASCTMRLLEPIAYNRVQERELVQDEAKKIAFFAEGEIQAEINRLLRTQKRAL